MKQQGANDAGSQRTDNVRYLPWDSRRVPSTPGPQRLGTQPAEDQEKPAGGMRAAVLFCLASWGIVIWIAERAC